jgi:hypothetical protein
MIPMRVYAYAALAIAIGLFCWWLYAKGHSAGEAEVRAEYAEALAAEKAKTEAAENRARQITEDKDREYQANDAKRQAQIDALIADPGGPIRMCVNSSPRPAAGVSNTATEPNDAPARVESDMRGGDDLSKAILVLASRCESDRIKVIALQSWILSQRQSWLAANGLPLLHLSAR